MRPGETSPIAGNNRVIEMLEVWLKEAKKGEIGWMGLFAASYPSNKHWGYAGITDLERLGLEANETLLQEVMGGIKNRTLPEDRPDIGADRVVYNCANSPMGWDFLVWLVDAEMTRRREQAPAPLKVKFWFGRDGQVGLRGHEQMFHNVYRPLLPLIGAVEDESDELGRNKRVFVLRDITAAALAGETVPTVQASALARETVAEWFKDGQKPITITLREAGHWPHRNSHIGSWVHFARDMRQRGEKVVIIRDTVKTEEPLEGFILCPAASVNVDIRMALYESAKCNMLVSNGPCGLCLFSDAPYLYFLEINKDDPHPPNQPGFWPKSNGIEEGGQLPWSGPHQRFVWRRDTYENISEAWEHFQPALKKVA